MSSKRNQLKTLIPLLRENEVRLFKRLYHQAAYQQNMTIDKLSDLECDQMDIDDIIDKIPPDMVQWALTQVEITIANHLKEM